MTRTTNIKAADSPTSKLAILGTFEGECADANITNLNGLDITRDVWETVFNSTDYKDAIRLGWYIGFLGHPDDPNCMDFEHACIVMTDGHIDESGKVHGKFNLIDTPVGRIVKAFIDAGVTFGISVRGAGDIVDNSVDPDTFVFRGFDLVTFPAFPESIPTFSEIAASTDLTKRAKYKSVCAAVNTNLSKITMNESLDIIQSQFAAQSKEYQAVEAHKHTIKSATVTATSDIAQTKIDSMVMLYLDEVQSNTKLRGEVESLRRQLSAAKADSARKLSSVERICASQLNKLQDEHHSLELSYKRLTAANSRLAQANKKHIIATQQLRQEVNTLQKSNLKYKQEITANTNVLHKKDSTISCLRSDLDETVNAESRARARTSNLDAQNKKLQSQVAAAQQLLADYQDAYAKLYATAVGADLKNLTVTATTSVEDLQRAICGTNTSNMSGVFVEPAPIDIAGADLEEDIITM